MNFKSDNYKYDDIINLPHHTSLKHPRMPMIDRAAQFSPFAALTGYDAAVKETARLTDERIELDESTKMVLDEKLCLIVSTPAGYKLNPELNIMTYIEHFEEYWLKAQSSITTQTKLELLKKAVELYRGNLYDSASSEHWILAHELSYKYKCLGIYNEIMRIFYDMQDYSKSY